MRPRHSSGRACLGLALCLALAPLRGFAEARNRLPAWSEFHREVAGALHAFRQTDHWIAGRLADNMDGDRQGRNNEFGRPHNFDAAHNLLYHVADLDNDGRNEVLLLFSWTPIQGNREAPGVVMQRHGQTWRLVCEFNDWGEGPAAGVRVLNRRSHGWRHFVTSEGETAWRPSRETPGQMECIPAPRRR